MSSIVARAKDNVFSSPSLSEVPGGSVVNLEMTERSVSPSAASYYFPLDTDALGYAPGSNIRNVSPVLSSNLDFASQACWVGGALSNLWPIRTTISPWTADTNGSITTRAWRSMKYDHGVYVVVGGTPGTPFTRTGRSTDGLNWTINDSGIYSGAWGDISFGANVFVAREAAYGGLAYSSDGSSWSSASGPGASDVFDIKYCCSRFIATFTSNNEAAYSLDGANWSLIPTATVPRQSKLVASPSRLLAVGTAAPSVSYSIDGGDTWVLVPNALSTISNRLVAYGAGVFVALDVGSSVGHYSLDGTSWNAFQMPSSASWYELIYTQNGFIASAFSGNVLYYSVDGRTWVTQDVGYAIALLCLGPDKLVGKGYTALTTLYYQNIADVGIAIDQNKGWIVSAGTGTVSNNSSEATIVGPVDSNSQFLERVAGVTTIHSTDGNSTEAFQAQAGTSYTVSAYMRQIGGTVAPAPTGFRLADALAGYITAGSQTLIKSSIRTLSSLWRRSWATANINSSLPVWPYIEWSGNLSAEIKITGLQVEQNPFVSAYTSGNRGMGLLAYNLRQSCGVDWNGDWTIMYWKKMHGTHSGLTGYNVDVLGKSNNSPNGGFLRFGKNNASETIIFNGVTSPISFANDLQYTWCLNVVRKSGPAINFRMYSADKSVGGLLCNISSTIDTGDNSDYFVTSTSTPYDFQLGGYDQANAMNAYYKDLFVIPGVSLTDGEITNYHNSKLRLDEDGAIRSPAFEEEIQ